MPWSAAGYMLGARPSVAGDLFSPSDPTLSVGDLPVVGPATPAAAGTETPGPKPVAVAALGRIARSRLPPWQPLKNHRRFAMRRFIVSLSLALVVLLGFVPGGMSLHAQEATPTAMSSHPIVGTWLMILTGTGGAFAETFGPDGSVVAGFPATESGNPIAGADDVTYLGPGVGV